MTQKEVIEKAYGSIPNEVGFSFELNWFPAIRGIKYYWYKLIRRITR